MSLTAYYARGKPSSINHEKDGAGWFEARQVVSGLISADMHNYCRGNRAMSVSDHYRHPLKDFCKRWGSRSR